MTLTGKRLIRLAPTCLSESGFLGPFNLVKPSLTVTYPHTVTSALSLSHMFPLDEGTVNSLPAVALSLIISVILKTHKLRGAISVF